MKQTGIDKLIQAARLIEDAQQLDTHRPHEIEQLENILSRIYAMTDKAMSYPRGVLTVAQIYMLRRLLRDYLHCAIDEGGMLDPSRKRLANRVQKFLDKQIERLKFKLVNP